MKTIFVNGCFDILHPGHIELFKIAKSLGDCLIVATDTDEKIKIDKGNSRPINVLPHRKLMLESLKYIDVVLTFNTDLELERLIELYKPDILVKGGDWRNGKIVGKQFAKEVRFFDRYGEYSTTKFLEQLQNQS
jgi:D-beta-D-heptose 7-phosphate kinase/D-beta-D-heptose 1-phosphate adenosyltransferase